MQTLKWPLIFFTILITIFGGNKTDGSNDTGNPTEVVITIKPMATFLCDKAFDPPEITIPVGTTIQWKNNDVTHHRITSSSRPDCRNSSILPEGDRELDSGLLPFEGSYHHTFTVAGTYYYVCAVEGHTMLASIVVTDNSQ